MISAADWTIMQFSFLLLFKSDFCHIRQCTKALPTFNVMFPDPDFHFPGCDISFLLRRKVKNAHEKWHGNFNVVEISEVVVWSRCDTPKMLDHRLSPSHYCFHKLKTVRILLEPTIRQTMLTSSSSSVQFERKGTNSSRDLSSPRATAMVDSLLTLFNLRAMSSFFNSSLQGKQTAWGRSLQAFLNPRLRDLPRKETLHEDCYWIEPTFAGMRHVLA